MTDAMQAEAEYLHELLHEGDMEVEQVRSGSASDLATWGGADPKGKRCCAAPGMILTFDRDIEIASLCVQGTVNLRSGTLRVGTITGMHGSTINAVTTKPFTMIFQGAATDPKQLGLGLVTMGAVNVAGRIKTAFASSAGIPKGAVSAPLSVGGWTVGDEILVCGCWPGQSERRTLTAVSGGVCRWKEPLIYDHIPPRNDFRLHVANLSRNVTFKSGDGKRGHFMVMHQPGSSIAWAAFKSLGRTDKSKALDDPVNYDMNGAVKPGTATNVRGRYSLHFHHCGTDHTLAPSVVTGVVIDGFPGWGAVNHSSFVNWTKCVACSGYGAAFVTENGDESGSFTDCLAASLTGSSDPDSQNDRNRDWGRQGVGLWLQGPNLDVRGMIAADCRDAGVSVYPEPLWDPILGKKARIQATDLLNPEIAGGRASIDPAQVPLRSFVDCTSYGCDRGFKTYNLTQFDHVEGRSVMTRPKCWNVKVGYDVPYTSNLELRSPIAFNSPGKMGEQAVYSFGKTASPHAMRCRIVNPQFAGFFAGLDGRGEQTVVGGSVLAMLGLNLDSGDGWRSLVLSDVVWPEWRAGQVGIRNHANLSIELNKDGVPKWTLFRGIAKLDGRFLYAPEQAQDFVPFPATGRTNAQILADRNQAVGGYLAPADAAPLGGIHDTLVSDSPPVWPRV